MAALEMVKMLSRKLEFREFVSYYIKKTIACVVTNFVTEHIKEFLIECFSFLKSVYNNILFIDFITIYF